MTEVFFNEQKNGYDKNQVDNYISRLAEAYQTAYKEYLAVCDRYNNLMRDFKKLEAERRSGGDADVAAKYYIDSEKLAKEIIGNAYSEEAKIMDRAAKNLEHVYSMMETAINEALKFLESRGIDENSKEGPGGNETFK